VERLSAMTGSTAQNMHESNVVPFNAKVSPPVDDGSLWASGAAILFTEDPTIFAAWFQQLHEASREGECLHLTAPTKFHATYVETHLADMILRAVWQVDAEVRSVRITV